MKSKVAANVETGLTKEEQSFTWTIENFSLIRMHTSMINSQRIHFSAGGRVGYPAKWSVFLKESEREGVRWIGIYFNIKKAPRTVRFNGLYATFRPKSSWRDTYAQMLFAIEGATTWGKETEWHGVANLLEWGSEGYGFEQMMVADQSLQIPGLSSDPEKLVIRLNIKLYAPSTPSSQSYQSEVKEFQRRFASQAWKDLAPLLENAIPSQDITIVSKDEVEFLAQKEILAARSPVFDAMMSSDMLEAKSGVILLPDISSKSLQVLLAFLNKGELHPDWNDTEVLVELTNAAAKYQLPDLLQFLDGALGKVCNCQNVLALFILAHELSLKTAEVELSKYIHAQSISPEVCCEMLKGMPVPGEMAHGKSLPKGKFRLWALVLFRTVGSIFSRNGRSISL